MFAVSEAVRTAVQTTLKRQPVTSNDAVDSVYNYGAFGLTEGRRGADDGISHAFARPLSNACRIAPWPSVSWTNCRCRCVATRVSCRLFTLKYDTFCKETSSILFPIRTIIYSQTPNYAKKVTYKTYFLRLAVTVTVRGVGDTEATMGLMLNTRRQRSGL